MAKASMFGSALGSVVNIILDPIFIFTFGMGAAGAAIATVLGNAASLVLYLYFINRKAQVLTVSPKRFTGKRSEIGPVFSIGIPASVNNLMQSFGIALCNRFLLLYGSDKIAAAGIASKISMISSMMIVGFAFGAAPLVGYTYGKGNREKLKSIVKFFYKFQFGMSAAVALVLGILSEPLIPCRIHAGGSIGLHTHQTSDDINFILSGTGIAVCDGEEEVLAPGICHVCKKGSAHSIINTGSDDLVLLTVVVER